MDSTDRQILRILQENARETIKSIGAQVGLTAPAAAERIRRLEKDAVITGYRAEVDAEKLGRKVEAFIGVNVSTSGQKSFGRFCESDPAVHAHYRVIGPYSALLHVFVEDSADLERVIDAIKKVGTTQTSIVLSVPFRQKAQG